MQLKDLVKPLDQLSDDELMERLRATRHNREVARPVARRKATTAAKKESRAKLGKMEKMLAGLSDAEIQTLLKQLDNGGEGA